MGGQLALFFGKKFVGCHFPALVGLPSLPRPAAHEGFPTPFLSDLFWLVLSFFHHRFRRCDKPFSYAWSTKPWPNAAQSRPVLCPRAPTTYCVPRPPFSLFRRLFFPPASLSLQPLSPFTPFLFYVYPTPSCVTWSAPNV